MVSTRRHKPPSHGSWDGAERRRSIERRSRVERRADPRAAPEQQQRSIIGAIRTVLNPRVGVDRRKGGERRRRRRPGSAPGSDVLTAEELDDLLS